MLHAGSSSGMIDAHMTVKVSHQENIYHKSSCNTFMVSTWEFNQTVGDLEVNPNWALN
ncbi:hypothetical protein Scep_027847 [Stephania cephalantha]|uniref:Uncharacterized protein n=1 Tax=Stephania cephalantha TaxID=152367 RepID=A0AAP0E8Q2_9MAGN